MSETDVIGYAVIPFTIGGEEEEKDEPTPGEEYTPTTIFGELAVERLEPWLTPSMARYVDAVGEVFQKVLLLAQEEGTEGEETWVPAWTKLLNPLTAPNYALPYLAQFVGTELPKTATESESRKIIKEESGLERGTLAAVEAACRRILEEGRFAIQERTSAEGLEDAYHFNIIRPSYASYEELKKAVEAVKPGGVQFSILIVKNAWINAGKTWAEVTSGKKYSNIKEGEY